MLSFVSFWQVFLAFLKVSHAYQLCLLQETEQEDVRPMEEAYMQLDQQLALPNGMYLEIFCHFFYSIGNPVFHLKFFH